MALSYPGFLLSVLCCSLGHLCFVILFLCVFCRPLSLVMLSLRVEVQTGLDWTGKTRLRNDLQCVDGDFKPRSLITSLLGYTAR